MAKPRRYASVEGRKRWPSTLRSVPPDVPPDLPLCAPSRNRHQARRVRDLIRSRLLDNEFFTGRLPDEAQLMSEYHASRNAVRAALAELQREGLISRVQGAGTFAAVQKTRHTLQGANGVMSSVVGGAARVASRVLSLEETPAPLGLALRLGVEPRVDCLVVDVVTDIDGHPAMLLTSYLADPVAGREVRRALAAGRWSGDWYELLRAAGLGPTHRTVVAEAALGDELVASHLDVPVGAPVMRFERQLRLGDHGVPEYGFSFCRSDRLTFATSDHAVDHTEADHAKTGGID